MSYSRYMDRSLDDFPPEGRRPRSRGDRGPRDHGAGDRPHRHRSERHDKHRGDGHRSDVPSIDNEGDDRTLFVANLNYTTTWQELRDHLRRAGPIEKCDIFKDSRGYSKGFGLVVFGEVESMERALQDYNDSVLNDRNMKLRKAHSSSYKKPLPEIKREGDDSGSSGGRRKQSSCRNPACTVFVHNLDYSVTWQKLKDIFKVVGHVVDVEILEERKGAAIVQLDTPEEAIQAIALFHGQMLMDRPMQLRMDSRSPYQPDPLKLKLSTLTGSTSSNSREHHSARHHRHSHREEGGRPRHRFESRRHRSHPRSRSPLTPPPRRGREYSFSPPPPPRHGYGRRDDGYYSPPERDEFYGRSRRRLPSSYSGRHGYERGGRFEMRSPSFSSSSSSTSSSCSRSPSPPSRGRRLSYSPIDIRDDPTITSIFVKNLPFSTTWQGLKDEFRKAGLVKRAEIKHNPDGRPSGLALVWYGTHDEAVSAVTMFDDTAFNGRKITVQLNKMQHRQTHRR